MAAQQTIMHVWQQPAVALEVTRYMTSPDDVLNFLHALPHSALDDVLWALLRLFDVVRHDAVWPEVDLAAVPAVARGVLQRALPAIPVIRVSKYVDSCGLVLPPTVSVVVDHASRAQDARASPRPRTVIMLPSAFYDCPTKVVDVTLDLLPENNEAMCRALTFCTNVRTAKVTWDEHVHFRSTQYEAPLLDDIRGFYTWLSASHVTSVVFEGIDFSPRGAVFLAYALLQSPTVKRLDLRDVPNLTRAFVAANLPSLPALPPLPSHLTTLRLRLQHWDADLVDAWAKKLEKAHLTVLEMDAASMTGATSLVAAAATMPRLTDLLVAGDHVQELPRLSHLRHLDLSRCSFSSHAFHGLTQLLETTTSLQTLSLRRATLTTCQISALADVLPSWLSRCGTFLDLSHLELGQLDRLRSCLYMLSGMKSPLRPTLLALGHIRAMVLASALAQLRPSHAVVLDLSHNKLPELALRACILALATCERVTLDLRANEARWDDVKAKAKLLSVRAVANGVFASPETTHAYFTSPRRPSSYT
ncbi:hypothetical protein SPRG_02852 [Saprolegnia parasitica CBS 223.65]|uniref:F-box domain-containing protein n=1 Tax=Saprolegnia parasitica (strain CBS 223.65) TaxID=695850 RepID=A0A067CSZ9_SAPPC|nr:hypothetical protein SPRG_02852 [Saprolegnia parasitica CBS 223.65]KDO32375.1 hypothetical protein SPRG_02852 [Saprolegnia parasitica CBS 223.65]|eukprot:XP_012196829.1 hypothetical protein SPRG_02852 [Saprolegnia parasitica CBS 223.65]